MHHDLAARFGTPLYVYDLARIRERARSLSAAMAYRPLQLLYAIKANPCPPVARELVAAGWGVDAVSPGEVELAIRLGLPGSSVLYTENNMTDEEMARARELGVVLNCGSLDRLERAAAAGFAEVAVRFNPDIGDGEHAHVLTAGPLTKFGVHHSQVEAVRAIEERTGVRVVGAHMHIGSNVLDADTFVAAMEVLLAVAGRLEHLRFIDFGGGLGVPYRQGQAGLDLPRLGAAASDLMERFSTAYGRRLELRLEPGRFPVAEAGVLLTRVTSVKVNPDGRVFVGCDTGFNHLLRPAMYGSHHEIRNLDGAGRETRVQDVVGNICESGDILARDRSLPACRVGDLLAVECAGAYGMSMASTYNLRPLPAEVVVDGERVAVARERSTPAALLDHWNWDILT